MGTVGLSFGSPTGGTGFDVSATVASIVGNLRNVETPWNTQLTRLEGQDTALSNLGTLLANVSTDLSNLTDFAGILSQKTGSSSDTNVLQLTSASTAAVAGTHTVAVGNLALTSSGFLPTMTDAKATLTGAITLQSGVGGKPQTITLDSTDNTLAGLAKAINNSTVGITASVLTDSSGSFLSLVSGTSGANGNIVVSANSLVATSTTPLGYAGLPGIGAGFSAGSMAPVVNADDTLSGSMSIQVGSGAAQNITLDSTDNTLAGLAGAINTAAIGVTATVVTSSDGLSSLSLVSQTAGPAGTLTVTSSILDPSSPLGYSSSVTGKDASLTVDGKSLTSSSNTVTNLIAGVTFQLLAPSANGEQIQVVIGNDTIDAGSTINQFVTDYNSLIGAMNTQEGNNSSGVPQPLYGTPTLSLLQQQLMSGLGSQNPNGYLDSVTSASDTLSGSISIQVGNGTAQTVTLDSSDNTLAGMAQAINSAGIGVTANVITDSSGSRLALVSGNQGSGGALTVVSSITDTTTSTALKYNNGGSDISGLANLGITVSKADNGTISLDTAALTSALNSDFGGVVGFFQNANSWGQTFSTLLTNAGSVSSTGALKLAEKSNSTIEASLNANISKEEIQISAEQKSLIAELNTANNILQGLPQQLNSANELYSAITGYNQNQNG